MDSREYLPKKNIAEIHLYELLGIKLFRKAILLFERIKHIRDGKKNENYHPYDISCSSLRRFSGYLIYNSVFHVISLMMVVIYFTSTRILAIENIVIDVAMIVVVVLDVYCLMLQRYIYLRFRLYIAKKQQMFVNEKLCQIIEMVDRLGSKSAEDINKEKRFLEELKSKLLSVTDIVLPEESEAILSNIWEVLNRKDKDIKVSSCHVVSFFDLLNELPKNTKVISSKQHCVSNLQKSLKFDDIDNVIYGVCIITKNSNIETVYKKVFPHPSSDRILETIDMLLEAYYRHQKETVHQ